MKSTRNLSLLISTKPNARSFLLALAGVLVFVAAPAIAAAQSTPFEDLGRNIYFDANLSEPAGQSCASCHTPSAGFADPDQNLPVSEGVIAGRFGNRNSPSAAYATFTPVFSLKGGIFGGQFWDGRAADLTEQAKGPFLNPVEMNNLSRGQVIGKIELSAYAPAFEQLCGPNAFATENIDRSYDCMAAAIAAFEGTPELNKFNSKWDAFQAGLVELTAQEDAGRRLFSGRGKCAHCHPTKSSGDVPALFTDFAFHNIGLPQNSEFPFSLQNPIPIDRGLGAVLNDARHDGEFKTPHLRNIVHTPPFMHNGVLKDLKQVVHFYNTRDALPACDPLLGSTDPGFGVTCWAIPEIGDNLDSNFVGNLGLTDAEEDAIVAFMLTFSDDFVAP